MRASDQKLKKGVKILDIIRDHLTHLTREQLKQRVLSNSAYVKYIPYLLGATKTEDFRNQIRTAEERIKQEKE